VPIRFCFGVSVRLVPSPNKAETGEFLGQKFFFESDLPSQMPLGFTAKQVGAFHVPIVPMSVKAPVVASMLYIETLLEPEFAT
jgi:hypothetical protein